MTKDKNEGMTLENVIEIVQANEHYNKPTVLRFPDGKLYSISPMEAVELDGSAPAVVTPPELPAATTPQQPAQIAAPRPVAQAQPAPQVQAQPVIQQPVVQAQPVIPETAVVSAETIITQTPVSPSAKSGAKTPMTPAEAATKSMEVLSKVNNSLKAFPEADAFVKKTLAEVDTDKLVAKTLKSVNNFLKE